MRLIPALCLWWALVFVLAPVPTAAASVTGLAPESLKGKRVGKFEIVDVPKGLKSELSRGLLLSGEKKLLSRRHATFYPKDLYEDLDRATRYLAQHGYPKASINADLQKVDDRVHIRFEVDAGPEIVIDNVEVSGTPPMRWNGRLKSVRPGDRFTDLGVLTGANELHQQLLRHSYAHAVIDTGLTLAGPNSVDIHYAVESGPPCYYGRVAVRGAPEDLENLVHKSLAIDEGDAYDPKVITQATDDLRAFSLFRQIVVEAEPRGADTLDVSGLLVPGKHKEIMGTVGYVTNEGIFVGSSWQHRNLFGGGRGLKIGGLYSSPRKVASIGTWWPLVLGPRTTINLRGQIEELNEDAFDQLAVSAELSNDYRFSLRSWVNAGLELSYNSVETKKDTTIYQEEPGLLTVAFAGATVDKLDDQLWATWGTYSSIRAEVSLPRAFSENYFYRLYGNQTFTVSPGMGILAAKVKAGVAVPIGGSKDILPGRRFFAGGAFSNRGYERRRLGPKNSFGDPVGGRSSLEAALEYRVPLIGKLYGAVFFDAAQAWAEVGQFNPADLKYGAGPSLMIRTPIGPVRADYGFRLSELDTPEPERVFHFIVGNPF